MSEASAPESASKPTTVVADLGKQGRKRIKKLRRGEGPLLDDVHELMSRLESEGAIPAGAPAVVVVVTEKRSKKLFCV